MSFLKKILNEYEIPQLIACLLLSAFFIIGVLYLIFLVSPNTAYISLDATNVAEFKNVQAEEIDGILAMRAFTLQDFDELLFWPTDEEKYIINGIEYEKSDIFQIRIVPWIYTEYENKDGSSYIPEPSATFYMQDNETAYLYFSSHSSEEGLTPCVTVPYLNDEFKIHFSHSFLCFYTTADGNGGYNHDSEYINTATGEFIPAPTPCDTIKFENCRAYVVLTNGEEIDFGEIFESDQLYIEPSNDIFADSITLTSPLPTGGYWDYSLRNVELEGVNQFETTASGELLFSYARTPSEYQLLNQHFSVENEKNSLGLIISRFENYDFSNNAFYANGRVIADAVLSENNLFPDLKTWFRENVYLAPLTLITTIYGAFSLKARGKKADGDNALMQELLTNLNKYLLQHIRDESDTPQ